MTYEKMTKWLRAHSYNDIAKTRLRQIDRPKYRNQHHLYLQMENEICWLCDLMIYVAISLRRRASTAASIVQWRNLLTEVLYCRWLKLQLCIYMHTRSCKRHFLRWDERRLLCSLAISLPTKKEGEAKLPTGDCKMSSTSMCTKMLKPVLRTSTIIWRSWRSRLSPPPRRHCCPSPALSTKNLR